MGVLIHDAQYDEPEMHDKHGWGHSSIQSVLELGRMAETPHLVLFHHDPDRDDDALDAFGDRAAAWLAEQGSTARATVAREGLSLVLEDGRAQP